jgi:low temperature requirement protein LtrA
MLFANRFGDPLRPLRSDDRPGAARVVLLIRMVCFIQMATVVVLALDEPGELGAEGLDSGFAWASAVALITLATLRELGLKLKPAMASYVAARRPWEIAAIAFFLASALMPGPGVAEILWFGGLMLVVVPGFFLARRGGVGVESLRKAEHISERLMLFVLIISGDIFLKIIVYWNTDLAGEQFSVVQLVLVSSIIFSFFRLYMQSVRPEGMPFSPKGLAWWLLLHLVLCFSILVAAGGMVEYVAPKEGVTAWSLMTAGLGLALAIACLAALALVSGSRARTAGPRFLGLLAASAVLVTISVTYLSPEDWRIGMMSLAALMFGFAITSSWRNRV